MALNYIYSDSTGSTIDITDRCRVNQLSVKDQAEEGAVAISSLVVDDPDGDIDFTGHRRFYIYEDTAPAGDQLIYNGFTFNERITRGPNNVGAGRQWTLDLADVNVFLNRRIMNGADANRPAETDTERIVALLAMTELNTVDDDTFVNLTADTVDMDAADYRGQNVGQYIDDCRQASGKNAYVYYNETLGQYGLWYDFAESDEYDSGMKLSNVLSDIDQDTVFEYTDDDRTSWNRDPTRVASGVYLEFDGPGSPVYAQDAVTTDLFAAIDWAAPSVNVKTLAKAEARAERYLVDAATEDVKIHVVALMPRDKVNAIKKGQRVEFKGSHFPGFEDYRVCRVLNRTVNEISEDPYLSFEVEMDLDPLPVPTPQLVAFLAGSMNANPTESLLSSGPAWQAAHAYTVGEIVGGMRPGHTYECTVAGTSAASGPMWPNGGSVTDGTVTWTDLGAIWTQRYWSDEISNVAQFPGPGDQQWMGIYTRAIRDVGETVNVLTVERASGSTGFTGAWVYEVDGLDWTAVAVISGNDTVLPDTAAGNITPTNPATDVSISTVAFTNSVLLGGMSMQKVNYGEGTVFTATDGTELINANTKNLVIACSAHDGTPPWSWAGYATGTGTLTIGGTITSSGANGCANGYNLMGRGYAALRVPILTSFSIVQSAHNSSDPIQYVVFASPPTP